MENKILMEDMENIFNRGYEWNRFDGKRFLISGAYGMLASYIIYFLMYLNIEKNISVQVIAQGKNKKKAEKRFSRYWGHPDFQFINADILDRNESLPHIDYIIHAASWANPRYYSTNPVEVIEPNTLGTYHLLKIALQHRSEGFLFFSSGDIYGQVCGNNDIMEETLGCMDPLDLHSCYGESKRLGETLCSAFYKEYGVRTVIARVGHTYGPTMDVENDPRVFAGFMKNALEDDDIVLYSDGSAQRPFCYIADATAAFMLLLLNGNGGEAYNVTNTSQFLSIKELAEIIASLPDKKLKVTFAGRDTADTYLNNSLNRANKPVEYKLMKLGWEHQFGAEQGFERVYRSLKK